MFSIGISKYQLKKQTWARGTSIHDEFKRRCGSVGSFSFRFCFLYLWASHFSVHLSRTKWLENLNFENVLVIWFIQVISWMLLCPPPPPSLKCGLCTGTSGTWHFTSLLNLALTRTRLWFVPLYSSSVCSSALHSHTNFWCLTVNRDVMHSRFSKSGEVSESPC